MLLVSLIGRWSWLPAALMPILVSAAETSRAALTAEDILEHMAKVYADVKWYRDAGAVKARTRTAADHADVEEETRFTTAFARPHRFRFEFTTSINGQDLLRHIIWRDGDNVQTWSNPRLDLQRPDSLSMAIAAATGISGGAAHTVPHLLLPDEVAEWRRTWSMQRIDDGYVGQVECFRLSGRADLPAEGEWPAMTRTSTVWIEKKTLLLRRIDTTVDSATLRSQDTTTYEPVVDEEIPDKMLEFGAPGEK